MSTIENITLSRTQLQKGAYLLKIIAHPVKLEILQILAQTSPMDVSTLCEKIGVGCEISMMSHHLTKMKDNGILNSEREGKQVFYSIAEPSILSVLNCIDKCLLVQ